MISIDALEGYNSTATDINIHGQIVGYVSDLEGYETVRFFWDPENGLVILEPFEGNGTSRAYGLNDNGKIAGEYDPEVAEDPAFAFSKTVIWTVTLSD